MAQLKELITQSVDWLDAWHPKKYKKEKELIGARRANLSTLCVRLRAAPKFMDD